MGQQTAVYGRGENRKGGKKEAFYALMWKDLQDISNTKHKVQENKYDSFFINREWWQFIYFQICL